MFAVPTRTTRSPPIAQRASPRPTLSARRVGIVRANDGRRAWRPSPRIRRSPREVRAARRSQSPTDRLQRLQAQPGQPFDSPIAASPSVRPSDLRYRGPTSRCVSIVYHATLRRTNRERRSTQPRPHAITTLWAICGIYGVLEVFTALSHPIRPPPWKGGAPNQTPQRNQQRPRRGTQPIPERAARGAEYPAPLDRMLRS